MFNHSDKYSSDETLSVDASRGVRLSSRRDFIFAGRFTPLPDRYILPPDMYIYISFYISDL